MKKLFYGFLTVLFIFYNNILNSQTAINTTGTPPDPSAALDISFPNKGILIPRIALTSQTDNVTIPSPATSLLVYNTGTGGLTPAGYYYWNGNQWIQIGLVNHTHATLSNGTGISNFIYDGSTPTTVGVVFGTTAGTVAEGNHTHTGMVTGSGTINYNTYWTSANTLGAEQYVAISRGGTGLGTTPSNGQLLIGNGSGYTLNTLSAGNGIIITNSAGDITISDANAGSEVTSSCGTANYIPKIASSTSLSCSQIYDNGTNVGIGTATPGFKLEVIGDTRISNYLAVNENPTSIHRIYAYRSSGDYGAGKTSIYGYRYGTSGDVNGGTSWSISGIDAAVKGYSYYGNNYTAGVAGYNFNDYTRCAGVFGANSSATYWGALGYKDENSNTWAGYFMGNGYFSGNVGIGTTSPAYRLDLAQGTFAFGNGNVRTETRDNAGLQGNSGAQSGFFETANPTNYPSGASSWWHLIDCRHSNNSNNYALQIAGSFYDQKLYFRKTNNNPSQAWTEILTTSSYAGNITYDYSTSSMTVPNGSMSVIPGLTRTLTLKAGDIIYIDAHGGIMASGVNWACVEVGIRVNGVDIPNGGYTKTCVDYDVAWIPFTNWAVSGHYVVPANGNYTIAVYAGRYGGNGDAVVGGDNTTVTQGVMRIEKITQNY